jgi:HEPN domain-containing protein
MNAERDLARQWLAKACNDLLNADNNLKSEVVPYDTVCFHCQQAAEKPLKAYLVARGVQPASTHDLLLLLQEILPYCADAEAGSLSFPFYADCMIIVVRERSLQ